MNKKSLLKEMPLSLKVALLLKNQRGLHARAAAQVVKLASTFQADINVSFQGRTVSATSIMGLMMLGARFGNQIELLASGPQAQEAVEALSDLIHHRFHEVA